jgi:hypothetical protein
VLQKRWASSLPDEYGRTIWCPQSCNADWWTHRKVPILSRHNSCRAPERLWPADVCGRLRCADPPSCRSSTDRVKTAHLRRPLAPEAWPSCSSSPLDRIPAFSAGRPGAARTDIADWYTRVSAITGLSPRSLSRGLMRHFRKFVLSLCAFLSLSAHIFAQNFATVFTGQVLDHSGAAVGGSCSLILSPSSAFPKSAAGRLIMNLEACSAFTHVTVCTLAESPLRPSSTGGFSSFVTSTAAPIATGRNEPVPGWDLQPLWTTRLSRRTRTIPLIESRFSPYRQGGHCG